jgi:uncharacterized membrane protein YfcA
VLGTALLMFAAFLVAFFTLFTGFGLGTLLLPAFALVFPPLAAVAATAVVHGLNNLFKLTLLWRDVDRSVLFVFGFPAVLAAIPGATLLTHLAELSGSLSWQLGALKGEVTAIKFALGMLILFFAWLELSAVVKRLQINRRWLPLGGIVSGFFGGLSGHQGAFRAAFLGPLGLSPGAWAGTQAAIAVVVDTTRVLVYGGAFMSSGLQSAADARPLVAVTLAAFAGSYAGKRLLHKTTMEGIRRVTGVLLLLTGTALATGLI